LANPGVSVWLKQNKNDATLKAALRYQLAKWSGEFALAAALELEQRVLSVCEDPKLRRLLGEIQNTYLKRLGFNGETREPGLLFKGLLNTEEETTSVRERVAKLGDARTKDPLKTLAAIYGDAQVVSGVLVVGAAPLPTKSLKGLIAKVCVGLTPCPFWDPAVLGRVTLLPTNGFASYIPELASLRLSRELVEKQNPLHLLVVLHELAHAAWQRARQRTGEDWRQEFAAFSEWKTGAKGLATPVRPSPGKREDALTAASEGSPYSLLPDPPMLAIQSLRQGRPDIDGFVFARTERETRRSGDIGEDLADSIAAFIVAPERFCYQGRAVAPRKHAWIAREVFNRAQPLRCAK
jgi:hypothetical protein